MTLDNVFVCEQVEDILVVVPQRDFMSARDAELRDAYNDTYRKLSADGVLHLIFDLSGLDYFGSTFVGIMIRLAKVNNGRGGRTVLCHLNDETQNILKQLMLLENHQIESLWIRAETREMGIEWLKSQAAAE